MSQFPSDAPTLVAGTNVTLTRGTGTLTIAASGGGGGGAPTDAEYLVASANSTLTNERVLTAGANITLTPSAGVLTIAASGGGGGGLAYTVLGTQRDSTVVALADCTGLSFAVVSGTRYRFTFYVKFQTAVNTTGIRLSLNGPATTALNYNVVIPTSATAQVIGFRRAYNVETVGTGVDTANLPLLATIEGTITPSANGTVVVRFGSEVATSNVSILAGSHVEVATLP